MRKRLTGTRRLTGTQTCSPISFTLASTDSEVDAAAFTASGIKMYCPNCGSNNQPEVKFCTRCGTNLGVVSEALTGKLPIRAVDNEHMTKLMRDYYRGRKDTITGATLILAGLLIMGILVGSGMNAVGAFFIIFWMFIWGAASLAGGLGKWIASSGEMKSLGIRTESQFQGIAAQPVIDHSATQREMPGYSTGPVNFPSVTEQTTRQLNERDYAANPRHASEHDR